MNMRIVAHTRVHAAIALLFLALSGPMASATGGPEHRYTNRLIDAEAPYLLLHAHNPVDWYPWGPEAFAKARAEDKLIFLSVGYSTCFWCHVAERTLYSDPAIAALMNRWFVNVKVDREQRPDVDHAYMLARQIISGSGGWPNNVFLTPDLKAFYAGSYYPPDRDDQGRPSFSDVLRTINHAWTHRPDEVLQTAEQVERALRRVQETQRPDPDDVPIEADRWRHAAIRALLRRFDPLQGGFSAPDRATKFPQAPVLTLMLAEYRVSRDASVGEAITQTLDAIALGGIQDHLAGGFHRYSTDPDWSVPHFEKMLYDNAQLLRIYAEAHELFATPLYEDTARRIAHYLTTRMMAPDGGFYTAEDAQVDGVEGASYVWSEAQLEDALGSDGTAALLRVYSLEPVPHSPAARRAAAAAIPEDGGVLRVRRPVSEVLEATAATDTAALLRGLEPARRTLLSRRDRRKAPLRDEKIGVDLNGLAIDGFAVAGRALADTAYVAVAERAAQALWDAAFDGATGTLSHQVFRGKAGGQAMLADYAQFARGLLSLHAVTGKYHWRERAQKLMDVVLDRFMGGTGQLRVTLAAGELPIQPMDHGDVEAPSGTSAAVQALVALAGTSRDDRYKAAAARVLANLAPGVARHPDTWPSLLTALTDARAEPVLLAASTTRAAPRVAALKTTRDFVTATARLDAASARVEVILRIAEGYHVNANPATLEFLIPTRVEFIAGTPASITYPTSQKFKPEFTETVLDVYDGEVRIVARFDAAERPSLAGTAATVTAQACNDSVCLPPARIPLLVGR